MVRLGRSFTFEAKMSDPVFMSVSIIGDRRQMRSLYQKMLRLQNRQTPLVKNNFSKPNFWLGNLVSRLGTMPSEVYCRGTWSDLQLDCKRLYFTTETAWQAPYEVLCLIKKVYPGLRIYFAAEGDGWDAYETNDDKGLFYPSRYALDLPGDRVYCDTINEVAQYLSDEIRQPIDANMGAIEQLIDDLENDEINLVEFEFVHLNLASSTK